MLEMNQIKCEHDGAWRSSDLNKPCPGCKSRQYPIIGYRYPYEVKQIMITLVIMAVILFLGILAGSVFVIVTRLSLL